MSATTHRQWTSDLFGPGALRGQSQEADTELSPYCVHIGEETYDQTAFTANTSDRYHAFAGGVGSGKTIGGIIRLAANVEAWNAGEMGAIITPTTLGIKNTILPKLERWGFFQAGWEYHGPQSERPGLHAPNGTRILLESANNERKIERLRGYDLAWFWLDEAAFVPERAWDVLTGRLRVGNYRNAWITTTPKGYNWVYDRFHPDSDDQLGNVNTVLGVPSYANPHLPLDYRRDILDEYRGQFYEQEVEGGFVTPEGLVYPWFDRDDHVRPTDQLPDTFDRFIYGVDWGFYPHPAAMLAIGVRDGTYWLLEEHYETRNTTADLADVLIGPEDAPVDGWFDRYEPGPVFCDPSEPANIEQFQRRGIRARKATNDVEPGIQHVSSLADQLRVHDTCQAFINEMNQYQYADDGDRPVDENDHAADAFRYAAFTDDRTGGGDTITRSKHSLGGIM